MKIERLELSDEKKSVLAPHFHRRTTYVFVPIALSIAIDFNSKWHHVVADGRRDEGK